MRASRILAMVSLAACADATGGDQTTFECDHGQEVVVESRDGEVSLVVDEGEPRLLPHVVSASGAKFSDGRMTFWSKGTEAIVEFEDGRWTGCRVVR